MSVLNNSLLLGAPAGGAAGYSISRSLRFNSADSAFLSRTPASAGNRKTWTWAGWVKRSTLATGTRQSLFSSTGATDSDWCEFGFENDEKFYITVLNVTNFSSAVYRDVSAWMHVVVAFNTTLATVADRAVIYINGSRIPITVNIFAQNTDYGINRAAAHNIGNSTFASRFFSGYLADIHFIDGQALDPTSFGEFSATTGVWMPKAYTGTYGTNGFRLNFADNSAATATTLGKDAAGSNNWTPNNLSVTAGAGNDSLVDVPTNGSEVDTGSGGQVRGNYCTINPLDQRFTDNGTISNGNLDYSQSSTGSRTARCTIGVSSGKWYWEFTHLGGNASHGISKSTSSLASYPGGADADGWSWFAGGNMYNNGGSVSAYSGLTYTTNDVIGVALNLDAGTLTYYKNGVSQGTAVSGLTGTWFPSFGSSSVAVVSFTANFGQRPFAYTAPSGFKALCTANLPAPVVTKPSDLFDVKLYTSNAGTLTVSGVGFSPDFAWLKSRGTAVAHALYDTVRGAGRALKSNTTEAEQFTTDGFVSFNSDGFTLGANTSSPQPDINFTNNVARVAWVWDAGSSTVTDNTGSIQSSRRTNASAGISIVGYTGNGTAGATVGHGLNVAPQLLINKRRSSTGTTADWAVWHKSVADISGSSYVLFLNTTDAALSASNRFNSTAPTSSVFTLGNADATNYNGGTFVTYCFAPVAGYSAFGSYTGNGSADGPFVYTGFRPRWVMIKITNTGTSIDHWVMWDTARDDYNVADSYLLANNPQQEVTSSTVTIDALSNGFKLRNSSSNQNGSGSTYIFAAFAEAPFQYARAR